MGNLNPVPGWFVSHNSLQIPPSIIAALATAISKFSTIAIFWNSAFVWFLPIMHTIKSLSEIVAYVDRL